MEIFEKSIEPNILYLQLGSTITDNSAEGELELDIDCQKKLNDKLIATFDNKINIILDLNNVIYIDSSGLWALFEGYKKSVSTNLSFCLLNINKDVKRVFDITKMSSKFSICEDLESAVKLISK